MALYQKSDYIRVVTEQSSDLLSEDNYRSEFWKDYARLIHSSAFRRLQGKTQLYPSHENDYFRTRLTHSMEVSQIAKTIALKINHFHKVGIDTDLVQFAALTHDIGHPPFGHQGEEALDSCMLDHGGFEGNAQTLRIITRLEKKLIQTEVFEEATHEDLRVGLNLTSRSIASILKYDFVIPTEINSRELYDKNLHPVKGYNHSEQEIVSIVKENVLNGYELKDITDEKGNVTKEKFKTLECQIMDISDDIAYSTYDLDDTLKANFCNPFDIAFPDTTILDKICEKTSKIFNRDVSKKEVQKILQEIFKVIIYTGNDEIRNKVNTSNLEDFVKFALDASHRASRNLAQNGQARNLFTSKLINRYISGIQFIPHGFLPLSSVKLDDAIKMEVEVLKTFNYEVNIQSSKLKIAAYRGKEIVKELFKILFDDKKQGFMLLPDDFKSIYLQAKNENDKRRTVCDFIAGMTDKYCVEFYARLTSENPISIFKPF